MRRLLPVCALVTVTACGAAGVPKMAAHEATSGASGQSAAAVGSASDPIKEVQPTATATPAASASPTSAAASAKPSPHPVAAVTTENVIIAGDSIPEDLGPIVVRTLAGPHFTGHTESHPSTGLVREDFFNWPQYAQRIAAQHPTTVIMMLGGNDNQPIVLPGQPFLQPASLRWDAEYARRAGEVMDALHAGGVQHVYWLTMPTTDLAGMNTAVTAMGLSLQNAARGRPWVTVYRTDTLLGAIAGTAAAHQPDGIHLSLRASQMIANALVGRIRLDSHLT